MTPAEVQTSVMRCLPSASSVMLCSRRPTRMSTSATARLIADATTVSPSPSAGASSARGSISRGSALARMPAAARTISAPSMPAAKYSALENPYGCSSSGGEAASRSMESASSAAARLTIDSSASESRPTEPVSHQANALSEIVATAAAMDSQANRSRLVEAVNIGTRLLYLGNLGQSDLLAGRGRETPDLQDAAQRRAVHDDAARRRMRHGVTRLDLLARPALENHELSETAPRPRRLILVAGEVRRGLQYGRRIELIGREIASPAHPALRGAKPGDRQPLRQMLFVVPGVEFLLHR